MKRTREILEYFIRKVPHFNAQKLNIELSFSLTRHRTIGQCRRISKGNYEIRLHEFLYETYKDEYLLHVVPHELAHAITLELYGRGARPHGAEFKAVLELLEGRKIPKKERPRYEALQPKRGALRRFSYTCRCERVHRLTAIIHNRIQRNTHNYICKICKDPLILLTSI